MEKGRKGRQNEDNYSWLKRYLEIITEIANKVKNTDYNHLTNNYGYHSALKLICVYYYSSTFLTVAKGDKQQNLFDGAVYIDLFGGSGLVKLKDSNYLVAGSALCAAYPKSGHSFDYIVCVEKEREYKKALESRLNIIEDKNKFRVLEGDCNDCISEVVDLIKGKFSKPIILTFVDPEGMEINWNTLEVLSSNFKYIDFMINIASHGIIRVEGRLAKGDSTVKKRVEEYYGKDVKDILFDYAEGKKPEQRYQELINKILGKPIGANIPIYEKGDKLAYYILGYTRKTKKGSPYSRAFSALEERIGKRKMDGEFVKKILEQIHGKTKPLV